VQKRRGRSLLAVMGGVVVVGMIVTVSGMARASTPATWTATEAPEPAGAPAAGRFDQIFAVSCPMVGSCVAVGDYQAPNGEQAVIETLSEGTWTAVAAPMPAGLVVSHSTLSAVSCPEVGTCVAVGDVANQNGGERALTETLTPGGWRPDAPVSSDSSSFFSGLQEVTCPTAGWCAAFGDSAVGNTESFVIGTLSQGTWTTTAPPLPTDAANVVISGLSCAAAGSCVAVGYFLDGNNQPQGLMETLNDGTWNAAAAPLPSSAVVGTSSVLDNISCSSVTSCVADGGYWTGNTNDQAEHETLADGTWVASEVALPPDAASDPDFGPDALSCPTIGACVEVLDYRTTDGSTDAAIDTQWQGQWTTQQAPLPSQSSSDGSFLSKLTCPAAGSCIALGSYTDTSGNFPGLLEMQSGQTWTASEVTVPDNATSPNADPLAATCADTSFCVVAGDYIDGTANTSPGFFDTMTGGPAPPLIPATVTGSASSATATSGQSVTDEVTVSKADDTPYPSGTASFSVCGPTATPTPCTSAATAVGDAVTLSSGSATSVPFTPTAGGYWCFAVSYSGDDRYTPAADTTVDQCVDVPPVITSAATASFAEGAVSSFSVTSSGGFAPVTYAASGTFPPGVALSSSGLLSGTPAWGATGTFPLTITATDGGGIQGTQDFVLSVTASDALHVTSTTPLPGAQVGVLYSATLTATGGKLPDHWRRLDSKLPKGLTLANDGVISGTPKARSRGTSTFTVQVRHGNEEATASLSITVT
jgi:hypothetical protein